MVSLVHWPLRGRWRCLHWVPRRAQTLCPATNSSMLLVQRRCCRRPCRLLGSKRSQPQRLLERCSARRRSQCPTLISLHSMRSLVRWPSGPCRSRGHQSSRDAARNALIGGPPRCTPPSPTASNRLEALSLTGGIHPPRPTLHLIANTNLVEIASDSSRNPFDPCRSCTESALAREESTRFAPPSQLTSQSKSEALPSPHHR